MSFLQSSQKIFNSDSKTNSKEDPRPRFHHGFVTVQITQQLIVTPRHTVRHDSHIELEIIYKLRQLYHCFNTFEYF